MKTLWTSILLTGILLSLPFSIVAAEPAWIVAYTGAIECSDGGGCGPPDLGGMTPATFLHVDIEKKVITLLDPPSRRGETTIIDQSAETSDGWLLSGLEKDRGWTMVISKGYMTLSIALDGTIYTVFGRVMPFELVKP